MNANIQDLKKQRAYWNMNNDLCLSFMNVSEFGINRDMEWRKDIMVILTSIQTCTLG
jgi:hypothetical protein